MPATGPPPSSPGKIRDELKLNRPDAGWYQVCKALEAYGDSEMTDFDPFNTAYTALGNKLRPMVYELGFCRDKPHGSNICFG